MPRRSCFCRGAWLVRERLAVAQVNAIFLLAAIVALTLGLLWLLGCAGRS